MATRFGSGNIKVSKLCVGIKFDSGKPRFDLIPAAPMHAVAMVYTMGAAKYDTRNWEKGMNYGQLYRAAQTHMNQYWLGQKYDAESGIHHLAHAVFNLLAIMEYDYRGTGTDDRMHVDG